MSDHFPCPSGGCDAACGTFGSLVAHLRQDHGIQDPFERYGGMEDAE